MLLKNANGFIFDWDGTIIDSMPSKIKAFANTMIQLYFQDLTLYEQNLKWKEVATLYEDLTGMPRKNLYETILAKVSNRTIDPKFEIFNSYFSLVNIECSLNSCLFEDWIRFYKRIISHGKKIFISSSVPMKELIELVEKKLHKEVLREIKEILGSQGDFVKGPPHILMIMEKYHFKNDEIVFFGDGYEDYLAGQRAHVKTFLVNRNLKLNPNKTGINIIYPNFDEIQSQLWK